VLCGTELELTQGVDEDGTHWTRQRCSCGRTDILHIDKGVLDLDLISRDDSDDYEIFDA
jgi:hypothetical protein